MRSFVFIFLLAYTGSRLINEASGDRCYDADSSLPWSSTQTDINSGYTPSPYAKNIQGTSIDYNRVLSASLLFYEAQRAGDVPDSNRIGWRGDSGLQDGCSVGVDLTGGSYDAGDNVKFNFPMAYSATTVAWSIIEFGTAYGNAGLTQRAEEMVKWQTDYFIRCHTQDNELFVQVGDGYADHANWQRPEDYHDSRPAYKVTTWAPGSDVAGEIAAALAAASIVFKNSDPSYSQTCLQHAKTLFNFADSYRGIYSDSVPEAADFYKSWSGYDDELCWALAWLYKATGDSQYLSDLEQRYGSLNPGTPSEFSWDTKWPGVQVLLASFTGNDGYRSNVEDFLNYAMNSVPKTNDGYGMSWHSEWGSTRYAGSFAAIAVFASVLKPAMPQTSAYQSYAWEQVDYILGNNKRSSSYMIGIGNNSPQSPHHRGSSCWGWSSLPVATCNWDAYNSWDVNPHILYGALVGGPDINGDYTDSRSDYVANEVACDYNAGFQAAVAGLEYFNIILNGGSTVAPPKTTTTNPSITTTTNPSQSTSPTVQPPTTDPAHCNGADSSFPSQSTESNAWWNYNPSAYNYNINGGFIDYNQIMHASLLFYEAQRSGDIPDDSLVGWRGDSGLTDGCGIGVDLTGGYYDAGDTVKFGFPMAFSVTTVAWSLLQFPDAYSTAGLTERVQDMVKWGTDYFIKASEQDNLLYIQVGNGDVDHSNWLRPEDPHESREIYQVDANNPGSDIAGETAAALAAASIIFKSSDPSYSQTCLDHAKSLFKFADNYRAKYSDSVPEVANFYKSWSGYDDELLWSLAWLYKATGDNQYLSDLEQRYSSLNPAVPTEFSWDNKWAGVMVLLSEFTGDSQYRNTVESFMSYAMYTAPKNEWGNGMTYINDWGSARYAAGFAAIGVFAAHLDPALSQANDYKTYAATEMNYLLGNNKRGSSYVVGIANNPPSHSHHRASSCPAWSYTPVAACTWDAYNSWDSNPHTLYGALVGGPDVNGDFSDVRSNYQQNEVACDYNAAFQATISGLEYFNLNG